MGKRYDKKSKLEAIRLAPESGNMQASVDRDLGIGQGLINRWKRQLQKDGDQASPGRGRLKPDDDEVRRLNREVERLRWERDILKKIRRHLLGGAEQIFGFINEHCTQ